MAMKGATGSVKIIDKASSPLKNISRAFLGTDKSSKKANTSLNRTQGTMDKMSRKVNRLNRSLAKGKRAMRGYGAGIAKVASIGGLVSFAGMIAAVNQQADALDKIGKKAGNLGIAADELQAMHEQAKHAGLSTDDLNGSMTRFTKRLGTFQATGGGLMAGVVKKLSPALAMQLKGAKTNQEAYEMLLKTYKKLPTQQAKMALADAAFGNSGRKQLLMLDEGVEGLIESRKRLAELGGGASQADIQAAADYNDTMQDLSFAINSIKIKALTPILQEVSGLMLSFTEKFKNADYREEAIAKVTSAVRGVFEVIKSGIGILSTIKNNFNEVVAGVLLFKVGMFALNAVMAANPIGLLVAGIAAVVVGLGYAYTEFEGFRNFVDDTGKFLLRVFEGIGIVINNIFSFISGKIDSVLGIIDPILSKIDQISNFNVGGTIEGIADDIFNDVTGFFTGEQNNAQQVIPQVALQTIQTAATNNNQAIINVNVQDGRVKSVETAGNFETDVFLNNGAQH